jgi:hypothetical protein
MGLLDQNVPVAGEAEGTGVSRPLSLQVTAPARTVTQVHHPAQQRVVARFGPHRRCEPGCGPEPARSRPSAHAAARSPGRAVGRGTGVQRDTGLRGLRGLRGGRGAPFGPADVLVGRCVRRGRGGVAGVRRRGGAAAVSRGGRPRRPGWCAHRWPHRRLPGVDLHKDSAPGRVRRPGPAERAPPRWRNAGGVHERRVRDA